MKKYLSECIFVEYEHLVWKKKTKKEFNLLIVVFILSKCFYFFKVKLLKKYKG